MGCLRGRWYEILGVNFRFTTITWPGNLVKRVEGRRGRKLMFSMPSGLNKHNVTQKLRRSWLFCKSSCSTNIVLPVALLGRIHIFSQGQLEFDFMLTTLLLFTRTAINFLCRSRSVTLLLKVAHFNLAALMGN
jgi:hypothetical protein